MYKPIRGSFKQFSRQSYFSSSKFRIIILELSYNTFCPFSRFFLVVFPPKMRSWSSLMWQHWNTINGKGFLLWLFLIINENLDLIFQSYQRIYRILNSLLQEKLHFSNWSCRFTSRKVQNRKLRSTCILYINTKNFTELGPFVPLRNSWNDQNTLNRFYINRCMWTVRKFHIREFK